MVERKTEQTFNWLK